MCCQYAFLFRLVSHMRKTQVTSYRCIGCFIREPGNTCIRQIRTVFSNARIHVGVFGKFFVSDYYEPQQLVNAQLERLAGENGCFWIPNNENVFGAKTQCNDNVHPSYDGYVALYQSVRSYMENGCCFAYTSPAVENRAFGLTFKEQYSAGRYSLCVEGILAATQLTGGVAYLGSVDMPIGYRIVCADIELSAKGAKIPVRMFVIPRVYSSQDHAKTLQADVFLTVDNAVCENAVVSGPVYFTLEIDA